MRLVLAVALATMTLGLASRPLDARMQAGDAPLLKAVDMVDISTGWAVTEEGANMLRTTDGGSTWRDVTPVISSGGQSRVSVFAIFTALAAWITVDSPAAATQIFRTTDGGRMWRNGKIPASSAGSPPMVNSIHFIDARNGWLLSIEGTFAGSNFAAIYHSSDGGETWIEISAMRPLAGYKKAATFLDATTGWVTGNDIGSLLLFVTHDGGRSWQPQKLPLPSGMSSWNSITTMPPKFFTARDGVLTAFYSGVPTSYAPFGSVVAFYVTNDRGLTWTPTTPLPITRTTVPVNFVDSHHGWVADGVLYATSDGGRRWMTMPPKRLPGDVTQLDFISPKVGWAIGWAVSDKVMPLHKTMDGGRTWIPETYTILR